MEKGIKRGSTMTKIGKMTVAGCLTAFLLVAVSSQGLTLPLRETFEKEQLGPAWTTVVSGGNSVAVKDGWLRIDAHEDGLAHIERPLGMDNVTITAKIVPCHGNTSRSG